MIDKKMLLSLALIMLSYLSLRAQSTDSLFIFVCEDNSLLLTSYKPITMTGLSKMLPCKNYFARVKKTMPANLTDCFCTALPDSNSISFKPSKYALFYKVQPGEGLFAIAKRKLNTSLEKVKNLNPRTHYNLKQNEVLHLGWLKLDNNISDVHSSPAIETEQNKYKEHSMQTDSIENQINTNKLLHTHQGLAYKIPGAFGNNRLLALHNKAPLHSLIALDNPGTGRRVYAKVVGRIPKVMPHDAIVVVSDDLARELGSLDKRFFVKVNY